MSRRQALLALASLVLGGGLWSRATAQVGPGEKASLRDILLRELRVRFPQEREFIDLLLPHVGPGKTFSEREVLFLMRKAQSKNLKFPFPYFQLMVKLLAAQRGLNL